MTMSCTPKLRGLALVAVGIVAALVPLSASAICGNLSNGVIPAGEMRISLWPTGNIKVYGHAYHNASDELKLLPNVPVGYLASGSTFGVFVLASFEDRDSGQCSSSMDEQVAIDGSEEAHV